MFFCVFLVGIIYSCAFVGEIEMDDSVPEEISCVGELSCYQSWIYTWNPNSTITCNGDRSCSNSEIDVVKSIDVNGHRGGENGLFISFSKASVFSWYSEGEQVVYFNFYGSNSGAGTKILCDEEFDCVINCFGYDACDNLDEIECDDCNSVTIICDKYGKKSDWCTDGMCLLLFFFFVFNLFFVLKSTRFLIVVFFRFFSFVLLFSCCFLFFCFLFD